MLGEEREREREKTERAMKCKHIETATVLNGKLIIRVSSTPNSIWNSYSINASSLIHSNTTRNISQLLICYSIGGY